jgi:NAD(P)-dependent dehydrogenase (short-subunit alcohol dehydrogenase family)
VAYNLERKIPVVNGGTTGIGLTAANRFAAEEARSYADGNAL